MYKKHLVLPSQTPHIFVDPLYDFDHGEFVRCYGLEDTEPIRTVVDELRKIVEEWSNEARLILCKSHYDYDQFGVKGLEKLCTTEEGRQSAIPEDAFQTIFTKRRNSIFSAEIDLDALLGNTEMFGLTGITTTSCITQSIEENRNRLKGRTIVLPKDAVGARMKQSEKAAELIARYSDPSEKQVIVVETWRNIEHIALGG